MFGSGAALRRRTGLPSPAWLVAGSGEPAWSFCISARLQLGRIEVAWMQCIRACLQACRKNALSPGFSRRRFPLSEPGRTTFREPVQPELSLVATLLLRALSQSTVDELHSSFSRNQDIFCRSITSTLAPFAAAEADCFPQRFGTPEGMP